MHGKGLFFDCARAWSFTPIYPYPSRSVTFQVFRISNKIILRTLLAPDLLLPMVLLRCRCSLSLSPCVTGIPRRPHYTRTANNSSERHATDRRTDRHRASFHNAPPYGGRRHSNCTRGFAPGLGRGKTIALRALYGMDGSSHHSRLTWPTPVSITRPWHINTAVSALSAT